MAERTKKFGCRILCLLLCICTLVVPMSGCEEEEVVTTGRLFRAYLSADPSSLDPQVATDAAALAVISNIYEGLVRQDNTGKIVPGVAKDWKEESDGLVYTFHLREDAKWSDETPVTAKDFYYAILRVLEPKTRAPNVSLLFGIRGAEAVYNGQTSVNNLGVTVVSDTELRFELNEPDEEFLEKLAQPVFYPCNGRFFENSAGAYGMESATTLCNGPFRFRKSNGWLHDTYLYLIKNSFYSGECTVAPSAVQLNIEKSDDLLLALVDGDAHIAQIPQELVAAVEAEEEVALSVNAYGTTTAGLFFNVSDVVFGNVEIRRALLEAVSADSFTGMESAGQKRSSLLIPSASMLGGESYREAVGPLAGIEKDSTRAKERMAAVLAELGREDLSDVKILFIDTPTNRQILNVFLTDWYRTFGFYWNMEPVEEKEYRKRIASGDFQIAYGTVTAENNSPLAFLESVCSLVRMDKTTRTELLANQSDRSPKQFCKETERLLVDSAIFYPLFEQQSFYAQRASLFGIELDPFNGHIYFRSAERQ